MWKVGRKKVKNTIEEWIIISNNTSAVLFYTS